MRKALRQTVMTYVKKYTIGLIGTDNRVHDIRLTQLFCGTVQVKLKGKLVENQPNVNQNS